MEGGDLWLMEDQTISCPTLVLQAYFPSSVDNCIIRPLKPLFVVVSPWALGRQKELLISLWIPSPSTILLSGTYSINICKITSEFFFHFGTMDILEEILSSSDHCSEDSLWAGTGPPSTFPFRSVLYTRFLTRPNPRAYWQVEHQSSSCYELISMLSLGNHTSFCLLGAPSLVGDLTNNSNTKRPK